MTDCALDVTLSQCYIMTEMFLTVLQLIFYKIIVDNFLVNITWFLYNEVISLEK